MSNIEKAFALAKERYAELGVDVDAAIERVNKIQISLHCWQGDDVAGFDVEVRVVVRADHHAVAHGVDGAALVGAAGGERLEHAFFGLGDHVVADDGAAADGDVRRGDALDVGSGRARGEQGAGGGGGGAEQEASAGTGELGGCLVVHGSQGTGRGMCFTTARR